MTSRISSGSRPRRRSSVWLRQTGEENALYDPDTSRIHLLNDTALAIWDLCDGETTAEEMIEVITDVSHLPRDLVAEDVDRVLLEFEGAGIVTWVEP